jgi:hypothetical protein
MFGGQLIFKKKKKEKKGKFSSNNHSGLLCSSARRHGFIQFILTYFQPRVAIKSGFSTPFFINQARLPSQAIGHG